MISLRAVVLKRDGSLAKVYYLDYGNSESLSLSCLFTLPPSQVGGLPEHSTPFLVPHSDTYNVALAVANDSPTQLATQMLSVRCSVYQWPELGDSERARARARLEAYTSRTLGCRVVATEGGSFTSASTLVQLYEDNKDLGQEIRLWVARQGQEEREGEQRSWDKATAYQETSLGSGCEVAALLLLPPSLPPSLRQVYLSYRGQGPQHFFVSRADKAAALARLMEEVSGGGDFAGV